MNVLNCVNSTVLIHFCIQILLLSCLETSNRDATEPVQLLCQSHVLHFAVQTLDGSVLTYFLDWWWSTLFSMSLIGYVVFLSCVYCLLSVFTVLRFVKNCTASVTVCTLHTPYRSEEEVSETRSVCDIQYVTLHKLNTYGVLSCSCMAFP